MNVVCRSLETYAELCVEKYELVSAPGIAAAARFIAFWIATLSVVFGLALGLTITWYGSRDQGLYDMSKSVCESFSFGGVVMGSVLKTRFSLSDALAAAKYVYVMAVLVGLYPAWRVSRMRPVQALHAK